MSIPAQHPADHPIDHSAGDSVGDAGSDSASSPVSRLASHPGSAGRSDPKENPSNSPTSIRPAPDAQLQKLAMLEGSARLRVAEQRVRHGLVDPPIRVQPSASTSLHSARHTRTSGTGYVPDATSRTPSRLRAGLVILALVLIGSAAALHWLR